MSNLTESHPELLHTPPRAGGIINIEVPDNLKEDITYKKALDKSSKSTKYSRSWAPSRNVTNTSSFVSKQSSRFAKPSLYTSTPDHTTRNYRIHAALDTTPWILFDESFDQDEKPQLANPVQETINILAIVISTTMLFAAGYHDIPQEHIKWTKSYLELIKDERGSNPPNVTGILNHLNMLHGDIESYNVLGAAEDEEENEAEVKTNVLTDDES